MIREEEQELLRQVELADIQFAKLKTSLKLKGLLTLIFKLIKEGFTGTLQINFKEGGLTYNVKKYTAQLINLLDYIPTKT